MSGILIRELNLATAPLLVRTYPSVEGGGASRGLHSSTLQRPGETTQAIGSRARLHAATPLGSEEVEAFLFKALLSNKEFSTDMLCVDVSSDRVNALAKNAIALCLNRAEKRNQELQELGEATKSVGRAKRQQKEVDPSQFQYRVINLTEAVALLNNVTVVDLNPKTIGDNLDDLISDGLIKRHPYAISEFKLICEGSAFQQLARFRQKAQDELDELLGDATRFATLTSILVQLNTNEYTSLDVEAIIKEVNTDSPIVITDKDVRNAVQYLLDKKIIDIHQRDNPKKANGQLVELQSRYQNSPLSKVDEKKLTEQTDRFSSEIQSEIERSLGDMFWKVDGGLKNAKVFIEEDSKFRESYTLPIDNECTNAEEADIVIRDINGEPKVFLGLTALKRLHSRRIEEKRNLWDRNPPSELESKIQNLEKIGLEASRILSESKSVKDRSSQTYRTALYNALVNLLRATQGDLAGMLITRLPATTTRDFDHRYYIDRITDERFKQLPNVRAKLEALLKTATFKNEKIDTSLIALEEKIAIEKARLRQAKA